MKKIFGIITATALVSAFMPISAAGYGAAGCGLGSLVLGSKPGFMQVFAATTNGTFGSQTFGITTGTSNCGGGMLSQAHTEQKIYAYNNFDSLKSDMAKGEGERLNNLASLMGCSSEVAPRLGNVTQSNFDTIYTSDANAETVLMRVKSLAATDATLNNSCSLL